MIHMKLLILKKIKKKNKNVYILYLLNHSFMSKKSGVILSSIFLLILFSCFASAAYYGFDFSAYPKIVLTGELLTSAVTYTSLSGFNVTNCTNYYPDLTTIVRNYTNPDVSVKTITYSYNFTAIKGSNVETLICFNKNSTTTIKSETFTRTFIGKTEDSKNMSGFYFIFAIIFFILYITYGAILLFQQDTIKDKITQIVIFIFGIIPIGVFAYILANIVVAFI